MDIYVYRVYGSKVEVSVVHDVEERAKSYALNYQNLRGEQKIRRIWDKKKIGQFNESSGELVLTERDDQKACSVLSQAFYNQIYQEEFARDAVIKALRDKIEVIQRFHYLEVDGY